MGYSNGANMLGAFILLHPGVLRRAILLRAIQVLEDPLHADISGTKVLVLEGSEGPSVGMAPAVADNLVMSGAQVEVRKLQADHQLAAADVTAAAEWIGLNITTPRTE